MIREKIFRKNQERLGCISFIAQIAEFIYAIPFQTNLTLPNQTFPVFFSENFCSCHFYM